MLRLVAADGRVQLAKPATGVGADFVPIAALRTHPTYSRTARPESAVSGKVWLGKGLRHRRAAILRS
jgi:hypothetical protein